MINSKDLEKKVLSGLLQNQDQWGEISSILTDEDFYSEHSKVHLSIFRMLKAALNNAEGIDETILVERIKQLGVTFPDDIDVADYIYSFSLQKSTPEIFLASIKELKKVTVRRKVWVTSGEMQKYVQKVDPNSPYEQIIEHLDKMHNETISSFESSGSKIVDLAELAEELVEERGNNPPKEVGFMSHYPTVNRIFGSLFRAGNITCFAARAKSGKANKNSEKILTPTGWSDHGSIREGDQVITPSGRTANVIGHYPQGKRDLYRFTFDDGRTIDSDINHLWDIFGRHDGGRWKNKVINTEAIIAMLKQPSKAKKTYISLSDPVDRPEAELLVEPYVMGASLGDGCMGSYDYSSQINISCGDDFVLSRIEDHFKCGARIQSKGCKVINLSKKDSQYQGFEDYGLFGKRSYEKFVPEPYFEASLEQRVNLLQGLFDTDGYAGKDGTIEYYTSSEKLAEGVQKLIWSIGGYCRITTKKATIYRKRYRDCFRLRVRIKDPSILFSVPRKKERAVRIKDLRLRINSVEKLPEQAECSCIEIDDPESLYITSNYIVTHNTTIAVDLLLEASHRYSVPILHFDNGEMSAEELTFRMVSNLSGIPINLLESGEWRHATYKNLSSQEVVGRVRAVWEKVKGIKIMYENISGLSAEDMVSLLKRIYYSEVGRGNPLIFSFDYIKSDFQNLKHGNGWAYVGGLLDSFKRAITKDLVFDGEPVVSMITSLQQNRVGIVSNKSSDTVVDDESTLSLSDNIIQFSSHLFVLRAKTLDELGDHGDRFGTHKLVCLAARHLGKEAQAHIHPIEMPDGTMQKNFINLRFENFRVTDCGDLRDINKAKQAGVAENDEDSGLPEGL